VIQTNDTTKQEHLRVMGNLCRFHDIKYDTDLHLKFTAWLKKKEIKWSANTNRNRISFKKTKTFKKLYQI